MGFYKSKSIVASALFLLSGSALAIPPIYTLQAGTGAIEIGRESDSYYYLTGSVLASYDLTANTIVDLTGEISTYDYSDFKGLDGEELFLEGIYSYTPRAGFRVPTYSLGLRYVEEYLSADVLEGSTVTLLLGAFYRLNDRSSLNGGIKVGQRDGDADSDPRGLFVNLDYRYSSGWLWYTTFGIDEGIFSARSYCNGAFSGDSNWAAWSWAAWSGLSGSPDDCDTTYLTLGTSYVINAFNTLELSLSHREYEMPAGDTDGDILSVDFFHRF